MTPTKQEAWAEKEGLQLSHEAHCRYCDRWQSTPHPAAKCLSDVEGMAEEITAALLSAHTKGGEERERALGWTGATCAVCGFRYQERHGHIIPCPVCELTQAREAISHRNERIEQMGQEVASGITKMGDLRAELANLNVLLPCGHRKVDMDDSYGECVFCTYKRGYEEYETELRQAHADLERAEAKTVQALTFGVEWALKSATSRHHLPMSWDAGFPESKAGALLAWIEKEQALVAGKGEG